MSFTDFMTKEEQDLIESQLPDAKLRIEAAKIALLRYRPFYGSLLGSMPVHVDYTWLPTMATNGRDLFYNPEFISGFTPGRKKAIWDRIDNSTLPAKNKANLKANLEIFYREKTTREIVLVIEHEIRHCICDHMTRGKSYIPSLWNIACDHYINVSLIMEHSERGVMGGAWFQKEKTTFKNSAAEFAFMGQGYADFKYHNWQAERIYSDLLEKNPPTLQAGTDFHMGSGSGACGEKEDNCTQGDLADALCIDPSKEPTLSSEEKEANASTMRRAIITATQQAGGEAPKDIRDIVAEFTKAKINYVRLIKKKMLSHIKSDVSYRRPNRRAYGLTTTLRANGMIGNNQSVVLPSATRDQVIDVWIGFDVSGSITDALLERIFKEITGLSLQYKQFKIHLFCWSTKVGNLQVYTKDNIKEIKNYKISTTGGTDAHCIFRYLDEQKEKCDQLIVFTDGYFSSLANKTTWAKKYDTLWVIFGNPSWNAPWGQQVDFDKYLD